MKKMFMLFILSLVVFLTAISCGTRITYLEELPHLPAHPNMQLVTSDDADLEEDPDEDDPAEENGEERQPSKALYLLKNVEFGNALEEYENLLHQDGWETTLDNKPNLLNVEKDDREAMIISFMREGATYMEITSY